MGRSLQLSCKNNIEFNSDGNDKYEITVTVDEQTNNGSFTVSPINEDWYTYYIKREDDLKGGGSVKIILNVKKNLDTNDRTSTLKVEHNAANITEYVYIVQRGVEYKLSATYDDWKFKSIPTQLFEEKTIILSAINGSKKWRLKEIQQYLVCKGDTFDDTSEKFTNSASQISKIKETRVPYDNAFTYRFDGNKFVIRSYGQIDLETTMKVDIGVPHMRYYFVFIHNDVNNSNKKSLDDKNIIYEQKKLFIFDGDFSNRTKFL